MVSGNPAPWQRATTRNGALWKKDGKIGFFGPLPPTARQIENWQPVPWERGKTASFAILDELWRAVVGPPIHLGKFGENSTG